MKKKIVIAACLVCAIVCGVIVTGMTSRASSANISIGVDNQTVKKEQEFNVNVTVSDVYKRQIHMVEGVISNEMAVLGHLADQVLIALDLLPNKKERGMDTPFF